MGVKSYSFDEREVFRLESHMEEYFDIAQVTK